MKLVLAIFLLVIWMPAGLAAQRSNAHAGLTRAQIREAESRLSDLGYWTGVIDGVVDPGTQSALIAFQKWAGRAVTGKLTIDELQAIRASEAPRAREPGYEHVEVDVDRQVLMLVSDDGDVRVLPVSTGNDKTFVVEGQESIAYTPRGRFQVYYKETGWQSGSIGSTYYANFISGGVAIHGSRSVPNEPASHGCIRIPMFAAAEVSKLMKLGTIVLVYDKVSFVSAKDWARNPKLKYEALWSLTAEAEEDMEETKPQPKPAVIKRSRPRMTRA
jgi:peptidoglycan hydrolase-like protein with peptidoglycan-binding domain